MNEKILCMSAAALLAQPVMPLNEVNMKRRQSLRKLLNCSLNKERFADKMKRVCALVEAVSISVAKYCEGAHDKTSPFVLGNSYALRFANI